MPTFETQIWTSARLTIERGQSETLGTIFRFYGPFTGRDMYNSLSPDELFRLTGMSTVLPIAATSHES
jgi:hypothetical protein